MKKLNSKEILEILDSQYLSTKDIQKLALCGYNRAREIRINIENIVKEKGKYLPNNYVPTNLVIDYLGLNISYLNKVAKERSN